MFINSSMLAVLCTHLHNIIIIDNNVFKRVTFKEIGKSISTFYKST